MTPLSRTEKRFLDLSVRKHTDWWCRHHALVGWIGAAIFLGGIVGSRTFGLSAYDASDPRSDQLPPLVAWIPELLIYGGVWVLIGSAFRMNMRIIGELHAELQRTGRESN